MFYADTIESKKRYIFSKMARKDMLDETKLILEKLNESEEKVIFMREDLNQSNTFCQQIIANLKELRQFCNKNTTELEDNRHFKNNIKKFNQQLLDFAQMIYHYMQGLYSDLNRGDTQQGKNEEFLHKNRVLQAAKTEKYKITQATLIQQLELLKTEHLEHVSKKALESEALTAENLELEREIEMVSQQIECGKNCIKNEVTALDDEKESEKTIEDIQESIECTEREINEFEKSLDEVDELIKKLESEGDTTLSDLDQKIAKPDTEIKVSFDINNCQLTIDEAAGKIEILEGQIRNEEEERNNYESEINRLEINVVELEEDYKKNIVLNEQLFTENEEKRKQKGNSTEQIKADVCAYKSKIEVQQQNIDAILKCLREHKPNTELSAEIDERQEKLRQLKTARQQLKQDHDSRLSEVETQIDQSRQEIETCEQTNKKLQVDTDALISELNLRKTRIKQLSTGKEQRNRHKAELKNEIQSLSSELDRARKNKKRLADTSVQSREASSTSAKGKNRRIRHWDSDSSIEGEDRRFSELIKQKMKMKKAKSNT